MLFDTLRECNSVASFITLSDNLIDNECMMQLGEFIQGNQHISLLYICSNKITDRGIEILSEHLAGNTTLKYLDLNNNNGITEASVPYLLEIAKRSCIEVIILWYISLSSESKKKIQETLKIPINQREIPIKSNTKSAAKISELSRS